MSEQQCWTVNRSIKYGGGGSDRFFNNWNVYCRGDSSLYFFGILYGIIFYHNDNLGTLLFFDKTGNLVI
ncbi:hypothetical protein [Bartonella rattimassiliensis]|uniref:hypothetical protein n=1 Tax=Bartonella rattimassiliensis TaxID=270250 RepID=UPI0018733D9B|nr:hypothetical protein [Bartonella rattimassiliensis]